MQHKYKINNAHLTCAYNVCVHKNTQTHMHIKCHMHLTCNKCIFPKHIITRMHGTHMQSVYIEMYLAHESYIQVYALLHI